MLYLVNHQLFHITPKIIECRLSIQLFNNLKSSLLPLSQRIRVLDRICTLLLFSEPKNKFIRVLPT